MRPIALRVPAGISARIVAMPYRENDGPAWNSAVARPGMEPPRNEGVTEADAPDRRPLVEKPGGPNGKASSPVRPEKSASGPASLPAATDPTWYGAQDIDAYPRSAVPLRLAKPAGAASSDARLLLWVRIDEHGDVVEVRPGEPGMPADWVDAARTSLAGIRFTPARKEERPVRSRLLISVSVADAP